MSDSASPVEIQSSAPAPPAVPERGSGEVVISIENVGKMYKLYDKPVDRLKDTLSWRFGKTYGREFWALQDINLKVHQGETVGILGRNGAGKSTLLQIISGVLQPTTGTVAIKGRVSALLELGSGFNPEYSGRENVYMNGAILGFTQAEIDERYDEIVSFADIGQFIDQPVKLYSSGMFVRLAFAVATSLDAEILLVDEVLAVGDVFFRQKCYRRLETLRQNGVSIILVSHAMNEVEQFCERAIHLHNGQVAFSGSAIEAVKRYYIYQQNPDFTLAPSSALGHSLSASEPGSKTLPWPQPAAFLDISGLAQVSSGKAFCRSLAITDQDFQPCRMFQQGETAHFFFEFDLQEDIEVPIGGVEFVNDKGMIVHGKNSLLAGSQAPAFVPKGSRVRFHQEIALEVQPGEYTLNLGLTTISSRDYQLRAMYSHPELDARIRVLNNLPNAGSFAVVYRIQGEPVQLLHYGLANLPGQVQVETLPYLAEPLQ
jgi:ABC-type polysaccharide/polyol phosphate transport system ATPase subunit